MFLTTSSDNPDETHARAVSEQAAEVERCVSTHGYGGEVPGDTPNALRTNCEFAAGPLHAYEDDDTFELTSLYRNPQDGILPGIAIFLVIGALMAGATFIGGDWRFGTIGTQLTWEPRRIRMFVAKAIAVGVLSFVIGILLQALVGLALLPSALWHGTTEGADLEWFRGVVGVVLRAAALGSAAALFGYAIAAIGRNTTAALGVAFAYVAVAESVVRALKPEWQRWLVGENTTVFLLGRQPAEASFERTLMEATVIVGGYLLLALTAAAVSFAKRDVSA
jgi:hypothetical protein